MSDDNNNDDFDLDEFDGLDEDFDDDLGEESWEEYDETDNEEGTAQKKTFAQKNFNLIVVGIVIIAACIVAAGQFLSADKRVSTPPVQTSSLPPAEDTPGEQFDIAEPQTEDDTFYTDDALDAPDLSNLPPVPSPIDSSDINDSIADSDFIFEDEEQDAAASDDLFIAENNALTPLPGTFDSAGEGTDTLDPYVDNNEYAIDIDETADIPETIPNAETPLETDSLNVLLNTDEDDLSLSLAPASAPENAPAQYEDDFSNDLIDVENTNAAVDTAIDENADINGYASNVVADLEAQLNERDQEIYSLQGALQALEQKIVDLENITQSQETELTRAKEEQARLRAAAEKAKASPTPAAPKTLKTTTPTAKAKPASKPAAKTNQKWILRSAQPGKALISIQGSNDMRTIEIGSSVRGIGKVKSIAPENGRWVVQGTRGQITQ